MYHKTDCKEETLLSCTEYDELGRARTKHIGSDVQLIDYEYNIRNWLTGINAGKNDPRLNAFSMRLHYNNIPDVSIESMMPVHLPPRYDGNIAIVEFRHNHGLDSVKGLPQLVSYNYDVMGRLQGGTGHFLPSGSTHYKPINFETIMSYDSNGNIQALIRSNQAEKDPGVYNSYQYHGNRLISLTAGPDLKTYAYDANGNMIKDGLRNLSLTYRKR